MDSFENSNILITGGTGTFGKAFIRKLLSAPGFNGNLVIFSRDEYKQYQLSLEYPKEKFPHLRFVLGDIRDKEKILEETREIDFVVHAAALKHVALSESNVMEYVKTNILGTSNVLEACISNKVKKIVGISTDKVVAANNVYGATKFCAEKILQSHKNYLSPKVSIVRFGNFMGSRGSVLPFLLKHAESSSIELKDSQMTRFYSDIDDTAEAAFFALKYGGYGEVLVPKARSIKLKDLADEVLPHVNKKYSGPGKGEKIHEDLIFQEEIELTYEIDKYYIINSLEVDLATTSLNDFAPQKVPSNFSFSSNNKSLLLQGKELTLFIQDQITKVER